MEGRSYEQIEDMTIFDIALISKWRSQHPPLEHTVLQIAGALGLQLRQQSRPQPPPTVAPPPDPRPALREAFKGLRFDPTAGIAPL